MNISAATIRSTLRARGAQTVISEFGTLVSCNGDLPRMLPIPCGEK